MDVSALIRKLWNWFDNYFLLLATAILIVFIPLYPKIPLADIIPGYIVRLRLDDVFVAIVALWWFIQLLRQKVTWRTPLSIFIIAYLVVGLVSNFVGMYLIKTIPVQLLHVGKSMLTWARHIQYLSLFFIAYSAVRNKRQALTLLSVSLVTLIGVVIYGYGQKYMYWPVFSTMNREFSKGIRLYLGEFARVQSTFAGHYDLGAYLVLLLPLALVTFFAFGGREFSRPWLKRLLQWGAAFAWLSGLWLLVMSAARSSFIGYLLAAGIVILLYMLKRGFWWGVSRGASVLLISLLMMLMVGDLSTRFSQVIDENKYPLLTHTFKTAEKIRKEPLKYIALNFQPPQNSKSLAELEAELKKQGMTTTDTQPSTDRPKDVYTDVPENEYDLDDPAATLAGNLKQVGDKLVQDRVFSDCALEHSLSVCIRLETLWPQAFAGFTRDPLFGSGYGTLTKSTVEQFTEAESTDNNFLRTLGENGAIGFFFYYGTIGIALWYSWVAYKKSEDPWITALAIGGFAGTIGLLVNAVYIDVFVASKVAYTFWTLQGILMAVFVKEGLIAPQFAFDRLKAQADTKNLGELLKKVDATAQAKTAKTQYLSPTKRRVKSTSKKKKRVAR